MHPYQYGYSNPTLYTDPSGECLGYLWGDPKCRFIGWENIKKGHLNWVDGGRVVVNGGAIAATVVGCAATALLGCALAGAGAAAVASWGNQALDNAGKPVRQAAIKDIKWSNVARDATIGLVSSLVAGGAGKGLTAICRAGPLCATAVGSSIGSVSSGSTRLITNITDGNPRTNAADGVIEACAVGAAIGGVTGRAIYAVQQGALNNAIQSARSAYRRLVSPPPGKTIAVTDNGTSTISGWKGDEHLVDKVMKTAEGIGHKFRPAGAFDQGVPGRYNASHAEKKLSVLAPDEPIAVSRPMCPDCQDYFQALAKARGKIQVIADPDYVRIFHPDGTIDIIR